MHLVWVPLAHNIPTIQTTSPQCVIYTLSVWGRGPHKSSLWGHTSPQPIINRHFVWVPLATMVLAWFLTFGVVRKSPQQYASTSILRAVQRPAEYCWFPVVLVFWHGSEKFASTPTPRRRPAGQRTASWRPASRRPASQRPAGRRLAGQRGSAGQRGGLATVLFLGFFTHQKNVFRKTPDDSRTTTLRAPPPNGARCPRGLFPYCLGVEWDHIILLTAERRRLALRGGTPFRRMS
jgi:hypothetical protein